MPYSAAGTGRGGDGSASLHLAVMGSMKRHDGARATGDSIAIDGCHPTRQGGAAVEYRTAAA